MECFLDQYLVPKNQVSVTKAIKKYLSKSLNYLIIERLSTLMEKEIRFLYF